MPAKSSEGLISAATEALAALRSSGLLTVPLALRGDDVVVPGLAPVPLPTSSELRRTVNDSLLPRSISSESRQHLLYAVLQDLLKKTLLLHRSAHDARPLRELSEELALFDDVFRMPPLAAIGTDILFPLHVSVPLVFDTYGRQTTTDEEDAGSSRQRQTDKGFRGAFLEFFSTDETGFFHNHAIRVVRNLFAHTEGLTPLDRALVASLQRTLQSSHIGAKLSPSNQTPADVDWWRQFYADPNTPPSGYRPLAEFAAQGARLSADIQAIAHVPRLSRIERVSFVERLLFYHFGLYLVRLTRNLYFELDKACVVLQPAQDDPSSRPWARRIFKLEYFASTTPASGLPKGSYQDSMDGLNEAYLLLPVLNTVELCIRLATGQDSTGRLRWADVGPALSRIGSDQRGTVLDLLRFFACYQRQLDGLERPSYARLSNAPLVALFEGIREYYSAPETARYPKNHHQTVFEQVVRAGPDLFVHNRPNKHIRLGDELIYLLVLALFEHHDPDDRDDSTFALRPDNALRRTRLPLVKFEERLQEDLLFAADAEAEEGLRNSLARLGLLDRLSDVGEANFLRHPTGV